MIKGPGEYIQFKRKNDSSELLIGAVCNHERKIAGPNRLFIHLLNDDLTPKIDSQGKKLVTLLNLPGNTTVKIIGFFD